MNKTEKIIERANKFISITIHQYVKEEQLSCLNKLKKHYISKDICSEAKLTSKVEIIEQLSSKLVLPLKVRGVFLVEGRHLRKYYKAEQLKKSVSNPLNKKFRLAVDHRDKEAGSVIGMVDVIKYDDKIKGLRWFGHINSEVHALNVLDGVITEVSATIYSAEEYDNEYGVVGLDPVYSELSLVLGGACKGNYIEAV